MSNNPSSNPVPNITSLDILKTFYSELAAPFIPYFLTILKISWRDGSPDTEEVVVHERDGVPPNKLDKSNYRGAKSIIPDRTFEEETCGSLYAPVSALGYKNFDYAWALAFKIDCDLARKKTGSIEDSMAHYVSDIAADNKIIKRRASLGNAPGAGRPTKTNAVDLEERYLKKMKGLSDEEKKEIRDFIKKNKKKLNKSDSFRHEDYKSYVDAISVSISAGPDDTSDDAFLSWLIKKSESTGLIERRLDLDEIDKLKNDDN